VHVHEVQQFFLELLRAVRGLEERHCLSRVGGPVAALPIGIVEVNVNFKLEVVESAWSHPAGAGKAKLGGARAPWPAAAGRLGLSFWSRVAPD